MVTTVDIDPEIVDHARSCLTEAGYPQVTVLCADAEDELPQDDVYDRITVTAGCWDIPRSWTDRLAAGGRLLVPLRLRELTRSVALEHAGDHWSGTDHQMCGFVAMQGQGAHHANTVRLHEDVRLRVDDELPVDVDGLRAAVSEPPVPVCTGVEVASHELFDGLHLWLITALPRVAKFSIEQRAIDDGWLTGMARFSLILVGGGSFAYHAESRPNTEKTRYEFVVHAHAHAHAHAPDAARLADTYANLEPQLPRSTTVHRRAPRGHDCCDRSCQPRDRQASHPHRPALARPRPRGRAFPARRVIQPAAHRGVVPGGRRATLVRHR